MELSKLWVYDIETFKNCFTLYVGNAETRKCWGYEISDRKDQRVEMIEKLREIKRSGGTMVGFNNIGFDYPVLHYILRNQGCSVSDIYDKAMEIIFASNDDKFAHIIWDRDHLIPQIDLYKIHHFDNNARRTSLKMLEFNMRSDEIQELPYDPNVPLETDEQFDNLMKYNKKDITETLKFLMESLSQIEFREELTRKYNKNFMNHNDGKIGKDYFIMKMEEESPGSCYKQEGRQRKVRQTVRKSINLGECILPYIKFERPEYQAVLDWLKGQTITETKGVFSDILESDLGDLSKYCEMRTKRKKFFKKPTDQQLAKLLADKPSGWLSEEELKSGKKSYWFNWNVADTLNCVVEGNRSDFGTGGIHMSIESTIVRSDEQRVIVDQDVASYYPNLAIANRVYPEHLSEQFCDIYQDVYEQRKSYAKGTPENAMLKLALNSVYGDSNNKFSPFFDPKYTMTITINGQLSLCMLAEQLLKIPSLSLIQKNTDGLTYIVDRDRKDDAQRVCDEWEKITNLQLEGVEYKMMAIRDVNSYIAQTVDGKLKNKGAYQHAGLGWHQNHSAPIIALAAEKALVEGEDVAYFIKNHTDRMDFMLRTKVPRSSKLMVVDKDDAGNSLSETQVQNITRYYACKSGDGELVKIMPPLDKVKMLKRWRGVHPRKKVEEEVVTKTATEEAKYVKWGYEMVEEFQKEPEERRIGIDTGWRVKVCNNMVDYVGDIDYDYYIEQARKLVDPLINNENNH